MVKLCLPANLIGGGMIMRASDLWGFFLETGAPEYYLLYQKALKTEACNVFDNPGNCAEGDKLQ